MKTLRFTAAKLAGMVGVLLAVALVTYVIFYVLPADPAHLACGKPCTAANLEKARAVMGLDAPLLEQFWDFLKGIVVGRTYGSGGAAIRCSAPCLGYSFQHDLPVTTLIARTLPVSASIAVGAAVLWFVTGVGAGLVAALRRGKVSDKLVMTTAIVGVSAPTYLVGLLLILACGFMLGVLPTGGYVPLATSPAQWAYHLIGPWCVLAFVHAAIYARLTRSTMLDTLGEDYVRTARAKGLAERTVITRHALRNTLIPVVTLFGMDLGALLGGTVITERVFSMYGMGALLVESVGKTDLPIVVGVTVLAAAFVVIANFAVDLTYKLLDPRV
jgi:peptide/nickel transport system permease protein